MDRKVYDIDLYRKTANGHWVRRPQRDIDADMRMDEIAKKLFEEESTRLFYEREEKDRETEAERLKNWGLYNAPWFIQTPQPDVSGLSEIEAEAKRLERNNQVQANFQSLDHLRDRERLKRKISTEQEEQKARALKIQAEFKERFAQIQREKKAAEMRNNNLQAVFEARKNKMDRRERSSFSGVHEFATGTAAQDGVGGTLLTNRDTTDKPKLGGKTRLGGKSLLGG